MGRLRKRKIFRQDPDTSKKPVIRIRRTLATPPFNTVVNAMFAMPDASANFSIYVPASE